IGYRLWRGRFGGDPAVLGRSVTLDGTRFTIIGVMSQAFSFPFDAEVWTPMTVRLDPHNSRWRPVVGRLKEGVRPEQARAELESISRVFPKRALDDEKRLSSVAPIKQLLVGNIERSLYIFSGAVAFVLLIACANFANLMLMRGASRRQ